jgi:N-acetyl-gamma-glutamyl-phosphate reductase
MTGAPIPVAVLGGSGYVAGELLRLLTGHPALRLVAVLSDSRAGETIEHHFPHLRGTAPGGIAFSSLADLEATVAAHPRLGLFVALPHGAAAVHVDRALTAAESSGSDLRIVDLGSDFRHRDAASWEALYGQPHGAPKRIGDFLCALPDLEPVTGADTGLRCIAHPGCFTTAATLALAPLHALGRIDPAHPVHVVAITGSTGAGRTPTATTHHPERRSDLFAYAPMSHRHEPEMRALVARATGEAAGEADGDAPEILFVPHSGPFARGIHATITARLARPADAATLAADLASFYQTLAEAQAPLPPSTSSPSPEIPSPLHSSSLSFHSTERPSSLPSSSSLSLPSTESLSSSSLPSTEGFSSLPSPDTGSSRSFVQVLPSPPRLQAVVGTNRCDLAVAVRGEQLIVFSAIDNLVKGAAGGGIQWMNRLFGLPAATGLVLPGLGWL